MNSNLIAGLTLGLGLICVPAQAQAGSLENLERERAMTIGSMLQGELSPEQREAQLAKSTRRLVDLERMVMRDKALQGDTKPIVRKAFQNYDLTFMVHASYEHQVTLTEQWLRQVGVSTDSLMNARIGRRWRETNLSSRSEGF